MKIVGYAILALAVVHLVYAVVGGIMFISGEDASGWEVFLHVILHPIAAAALVVMLLKPSTLEVMWSQILIGLLLAASIGGDVHLFFEVGEEGLTRQSMLALVYAIVPIVGLIYGIFLRIEIDEEGESRS